MTITRNRRLTKVEVKDLLGRFNYTIPFDADQTFLILHGPNGVGKTRLLELVHSILTTKHDHLATLPFRQVNLEFDDGTSLQVEREGGGHDVSLFDNEEVDEEESHARNRMVWLLQRVDGTTAEAKTSLRLSARARHRLERLERDLPVERIGDDLWRDLRTQEEVGAFELARRFAIDLGKKYSDSGELDDLLAELRPNHAHLIEAQRLLRASPSPRQGPWHSLVSSDEKLPEPTVVSYARDLSQRLDAALAENSRTSQRLDRSFPRRLFDQDDSDVRSENEIRQLFDEQLELRTRLAEISILDTSHELFALPPEELIPWQRKVLSIYLVDAAEKLQTFGTLLDRIESLRSIINERFLLKRLDIDRGSGFVFQDEKKTARVELRHLSSGEQHELVLLYDLLMNVDPQSLVLIDEPEISLHVAWQKAFLDDLERIADLTDLRFIVATHSPQIIGGRLDLAHSLGSLQAD